MTESLQGALTGSDTEVEGDVHPASLDPVNPALLGPEAEVEGAEPGEEKQAAEEAVEETETKPDPEPTPAEVQEERRVTAINTRTLRRLDKTTEELTNLRKLVEEGLIKTKEPDPGPDPVEQPAAAALHETKKLAAEVAEDRKERKATEKQTADDNAMRALVTSAAQNEEKVKEAHPEYGEAAQEFYRQGMTGLNAILGPPKDAKDEQERVRTIGRTLMGRSQAEGEIRGAAEILWDDMEAQGWKPASVEPNGDEPDPATPVKTVAAKKAKIAKAESLGEVGQSVGTEHKNLNAYLNEQAGKGDDYYSEAMQRLAKKTGLTGDSLEMAIEQGKLTMKHLG